MMPLDYALKSFSLADADDVHEFLAIENIHQHAITRFYRSIGLRFVVDLNRHFADELHRRQIILRQVPAHGLRESRLLHEFNQANLRAVVSIFRLRLVLRDHTGASLQHRRRMHLAPRIEELCHPDFFSQNSCYLCHFLCPVWRGRPARESLGEHSLRRTAEGGRPHMVYLCSFPNALISTSTPAGRSSFISASTVC